MQQPSSLLSRTTAAVALLLAGCSLPGCHSAFINATVQNRTGIAVSPLEVDYPSASFGTESLRAGADFRYRFKVLGSGGTKVVWTDAKHQEHSASGPSLKEGQEGTLMIVMTPNGVTWTPTLKP